MTVSLVLHRGGRIHWADPMFRAGVPGAQELQAGQAANVLYTAEFNRRLAAETGVRAYAADPGLVNTTIGQKSYPWRGVLGSGSGDAQEA